MFLNLLIHDKSSERTLSNFIINIAPRIKSIALRQLIFQSYKFKEERSFVVSISTLIWLAGNSKHSINSKNDLEDDLNQRWIRGTPQNFCTFDTPYYPCFIAFLRKNFRKFSKFVLLILTILFEKISQISKKIMKIFQLFRNRKNNIIFELKLVQNHYIDQNLVKFLPKVQITAIFSLKTAIFSKFSATSAPKICTFDTQKTRFFRS